ncbi:DNA-binding MarR family transcriptional regulator [Actinokineospora baliensis]|nr:DNA-binding MarR family transcriptional regulator [Actinokineospora baliensis]
MGRLLQEGRDTYVTVVAYSSRRPDPFVNVQRELDELRARYREVVQDLAVMKSKVDNRKKLSVAEVARIRRFSKEGRSQAWIADRFDLNRATVSRIVRGIYHPV